jgi:antitoxin (DNA-binding transcriptional repressor) of toxin-antitoxin stability system
MEVEVEQVEVEEARHRLDELVAGVTAGGEVLLLRRGKPAARLVALEREVRRLPWLGGFRGGLGVLGRPLSEELIRARGEGS